MTKAEKKSEREKIEKKGTCNDKNCPIHGSIKIRGRRFRGKVVSAKMDKTVIVSWPYFHKVPKYERYERRTSRVPAHNSTCIKVQENDLVEIGECRPIAKTVKFVVLRKLEE